jgi:hypothetical protein
MKLFRKRVSGEVFGPNRGGESRAGWRHESGAHGRHNDEPSPASRLVHQPETRYLKSFR